MEHNNQTRFLATYVKKKLEPRVKDIKINELEQYFDENGWIMYDIDTMSVKIENWRKKHRNHKELYY